MTLTLTPEPSTSLSSPPRVRVAADAGVGGTFLSLNISRDGGRVRAVPSVGVQSTSVYDYEAAFGRPVTYTASGTYIPAGTPVWSESWVDLTAWTGSGWSVAAGKAESTTNGSSIVRTTGGVIQRVVVNSPEHVTLRILDASNAELLGVETFTDPSFGKTTLYTPIAGTRHAVNQVSYAYELVIASGNVTATALDGAWSISLPVSSGATKVELLASNGLGATSQVGEIAATLTQAESTYSESATTTLADTRAWLIHPTSPSLSVAIDPGPGNWSDDVVNVSIGSAQQTAHESPQAVFRPNGRARAVVFPLGPLSVGEWSLSLDVFNLGTRDSLLAILTDGVPLLLRSGPAFDWDLPDDWYSVNGLTQRRTVTPLGVSARTLDLPLKPVDSPPVALTPEYSYGDVLVDYATYGDVLAAFPTYYALLKGEPA